MTRTLVLICEDWPIRAARRPTGPDRPEGPRPVAVWSHQGIVATNPAARAAGVRVGLRRREAQGRCPELTLLRADPARDARRFDPVVAALTAFTPQVEIVEPGCVALGTRGPARYFGGEEALAEQILRAVADVLAATDPSGSDDPPRPSIRVGVADGPLIARLAASRAPAGQARIVAPGETASFLAPIPVRALAGFVEDPEVLVTWTRLGLDRLGAVAALPTAAVLGRFGTDGARLHRLARGEDPTVPEPTPIPDEVDTVVDFDPPETRSDAVAFTARAAADEFIGRLEALGLSCDQVLITLSTDHAERCRRRWRLDGPARTAEAARSTAVLVAERVRWQTDGWLAGPARTRPSAGITRLVLSPGEVRPARGIQVGLWGGASAADRRAAHAIARLEALVGPDAVCVVEPRGGRDPAEEAVLVPTAGVDLHARGQRPPPGPPAPWPGRLPAPAPTLVAVSPRPIEVVAADGTPVEVTGRGETSRAPATVRLAGHPGASDGTAAVSIVAWAGPWPMEERWWDPERHRRQARFQLVTAEGVALLVVRRQRRWWLTGVYR